MRFVVRETHGVKGQVSGYTVLDTAFCFRLIRQFTGKTTIEQVREEAFKLRDELEEEYGCG